MECLGRLAARSPSQEASIYRGRRKEAAREMTRLSARFQVQVDRTVQLGQPFQRSDLNDDY